ncbi:5'-nucleotidase SurE [Phycisphaerae bacterium RAS1]|nr:5'-nucleotidase SurE [Phycisphaerae bacterium RAS1]
MRILVTNDDGILAPGIEALYRAAAEFGHVDVVAPETSQSAMGHAITVLSPMTVHRVHVNNTFHGWSVDGRPADCVKLAMMELLDARPDFVLSGINHGANTGMNLLYSGTVAGAAEGAFLGVPAMAVSLELSEELDFERATRIARQCFASFIASKPAPGACLNVNIPSADRGTPRGVRVCPQAMVTMEDHYRKTVGQQGHTIYWLDGRLPHPDQCPDSDYAALCEGYVTITPLRFDMTDHARLGEVGGQAWPERFDA